MMAASRREWAFEELAVIKRRYPAGGARACLPLLPDRSKQTIRQRAYQLGIRRERSAAA